jgi:ArsR family transcriptional regulator, arsenate/arsenite/antimonite-responsive transcriptional repressor
VDDSSTVELTRQGCAPGSDEALTLLSAAADPVRWSVLHRLAGGTACVCDLQDHVAIAPNLLSYHLKVLREAGLVTTSRRGRWVDYSLAPGAQGRLVAALPLDDRGPP